MEQPSMEIYNVTNPVFYQNVMRGTELNNHSSSFFLPNKIIPINQKFSATRVTLTDLSNLNLKCLYFQSRPIEQTIAVKQNTSKKTKNIESL
jgi:hypothetical protein